MNHGICRRPRNLCILTTQRSGSTWLMQLLNDTGKIRAYGEVFLEWARVKDHDGDPRLLPPSFFGDHVERTGSRRVAGYLDALEESDERPIAFKIMYDQVRRKPSILMAPVLRDYLIIHLTRKNLLDVVVSRLLARETRVYHSKTAVEQPVVTADPAAVMAMLARIDRQMRLAKVFLGGLPCRKLGLCYDDLVSSPAAAINHVLAAAGLPPVSRRAGEDNWIKTNSRRPREVFGNYESIAAVVSKSRFAWMLEGETRAPDGYAPARG
jgi:LPS sulfotransferase NodH